MTGYFLSYARADALALRIAGDLIAAGVKVWVDQYDIQPSEHWDRAVEAAVRGCDGLIVVLSPHSAASPNVADEVSVALDAGKRVIPILIEACTPPLRLTRMQFIDARHDYAGALKRCLAAIAGETAPAALPARASFAPELLAEAERRLTHYLGPIAGVLVREAAVRASGEADLYVRLAEGIAGPADRAAFLAGVAADAAPTAVDEFADPLFDPDLDAITTALMRHIGPIAPQLIRRERPLASNRDDLCQRLGLRISSESDRAAFLAEVGAAPASSGEN